jgi:Fe2+ transport system protein FeoA
MDRLTTLKAKLGTALEYMSLTALPHGAEARVVAIEDSGTGSLRMMEMGVVPGASISVVRAAPLGDPLQKLTSFPGNAKYRRTMRLLCRFST